MIERGFVLTRGSFPGSPEQMLLAELHQVIRGLYWLFGPGTDGRIDSPETSA
jgi:hypothetical protein